MADYTVGTGNGGIMLIRDNGSTVEFHIKAGSSQTYVGSLNWSGFVNGVNVSGSRQYPTGAPWIHLATYTITYNQQVRFSIAATNTQGLGGPTDLFADISRSTIPAAPTNVTFSNIGHTTLTTRFFGTSDGGATIQEWQLSYGLTTSANTTVVSSNGTNNIGGLLPGTVYYFKARGRNANGWGPWSSPMSVRTLAGNFLKVNGVQRHVIPYVKVSGVWRGAEPYQKKAGVWLKSLGL